MKTKKLTPRNSAPVQREINTTSSEGGTGLFILTLTSKNVKSLFLLARVRGLPQRIDVQPLLIQGFLLGIREKV